MPLAGPLVHPRLAAGSLLAALGGVASSRTGHGAAQGPHRAGSSSCPLGEVEVEGADRDQVVEALTRDALASVTSPPAGRDRVVLVVIRCFHAAAASAGRCSERCPG